MDTILVNSEQFAYSHTHMKAKLKEHFGDNIIQTEINGKPNVVTFRHKAEIILHEFHKNQDKSLNPDAEKLKLVEAAAKVIRSDIKSIESCTLNYPDSCEIDSAHQCLQYLPVTLKLLLESIIIGKDSELKIASIGQAIMQAARPRILLAPLQLGLGIQMHHHFSSRFLIDSLHHHGFCCSYNEVQQFEHSAAFSYNSNIANLTTQFVQYAADNVDHNIQTIDGNNTFHGMGMIAMITPASSFGNKVIPRSNVSYKDIAQVGRIPIFYYQEQNKINSMKFEPLDIAEASDPTSNLDILWKTSVLFGSPQPAWSGTMQFVHHGEHPGKGSIMFLPMIDMNPSDMTCVYSTLKFISHHAHQHNVTPIITFDQSLWWKAQSIIFSEPEGSDLRKVIRRLGGFHTEMSFLGCIGHIMSGSGIDKVLQTIYASNAVVHTLSGKAISRAIWAHLIVDASLNALLSADAMDINLFPTISENDSEEDSQDNLQLEDVTSDSLISDAQKLYKNLMDNSMTVADVCKMNTIDKIHSKLKIKVNSLASSETASLWLQYMEMINILRKFIRAERTGNWGLHLQALFEMLPFLAASGHNNYTKSLWIYLQQMSSLKDDCFYKHKNQYWQISFGLY